MVAYGKCKCGVARAGVFKHTQELLRGYMADATPKERHVTAFGQMNAAGSIGFIVGPMIGGHLAELPGGFYLISMMSASLFVLNFGTAIILISINS